MEYSPHNYSNGGFRLSNTREYALNIYAEVSVLEIFRYQLETSTDTKIKSLPVAMIPSILTSSADQSAESYHRTVLQSRSLDQNNAKLPIGVGISGLPEAIFLSEANPFSEAILFSEARTLRRGIEYSAEFLQQ